MSYNKRTWATGNVVGAVDLNRMEQGIEDAGSSGSGGSSDKFLLCKEGITLLTDVTNAISNEKIVYFIAPEESYTGAPEHLFFISYPSPSESVIIPESTKIKARFGRDNGLFYIEYR